MKKEPHKGLFTFYKIVLGVVFSFFYHPKCENRDYVPGEGPVIVCGNHIHLFDQCLPLTKTKRMLHYMAKKEYFDSKFAWFFRTSGCISVNREIHDDSAKNAALDVLNNGFALGIFAEGTRNGVDCKKKELEKYYKLYQDEMSIKKFKKILKKNQVRITQAVLLEDLYNNKKISLEEYKEGILDTNTYLCKLIDKKVITISEYKETLMLPIKFGTVSMAQKTGATIVPYVITGKYKVFKNNLKITFLKPFKVSKDDSLEEKNNYLRNLMIEALYKENRILKK